MAKRCEIGLSAEALESLHRGLEQAKVGDVVEGPDLVADEAFIAALESPPEPNERLKRACTKHKL